jgi:hypothetical protein
MDLVAIMSDKKSDTEVASLIDNIRIGFKPNDPLFDSETLSEFINYLSIIDDMDGTDILTFFEERYRDCDAYHKARIAGSYAKKFKKYPRAFFWQICLYNDSRYLESVMRELYGYIQKITGYILENEMDSLVEDIGEHIKEQMQNSGNDVEIVKETVLSLSPLSFMSEGHKNRYYPVELFKKITALIPADYSSEFE